MAESFLSSPVPVRAVMISSVIFSRTPLPGAVFDILRYDRSVLAKDQTAGTAGAFWVGELPFGTYYIHETGVPAGYDDSKRWFELTVDENGARLSEDSPKTEID